MRETEALVRAAAARHGGAASARKRDRDLARLEEEVSRAARHHRRDPRRAARAAARWCVHYSSLDHLDAAAEEAALTRHDVALQRVDPVRAAAIISRLCGAGMNASLGAPAQADPHRSAVAAGRHRRADALPRVLAGVHGALSAALGGAVSIVRRLGVARWWLRRGKAQSAGGVLVAALRAEAVKIGLDRAPAVAGARDLREVVVPRVSRIVHRDDADFLDGVFCRASTDDSLQRWPPAKNSTPTEYIQHHLTFLTQAGRRRRLLDAERRHGRDVDPARRRRLRLPVVGRARRDRRRADQAPGVRRARWSTSSTTRSRASSPRRPQRFVAPLALTVFVWVLLMNAMDFLPDRHHGAGLRARSAPARLPHRADRRRQHDLRARAVGVRR